MNEKASNVEAYCYRRAYTLILDTEWTVRVWRLERRGDELIDPIPDPMVPQIPDPGSKRKREKVENRVSKVQYVLGKCRRWLIPNSVSRIAKLASNTVRRLLEQIGLSISFSILNIWYLTFIFYSVNSTLNFPDVMKTIMWFITKFKKCLTSFLHRRKKKDGS